MIDSRTRCTYRMAWGLLILAALTVPKVRALVNPQLQPSHIRARYNVVIGGRIVSANYDSGKVVFQVTDVCKGQFEGKSVTVVVREVDFDQASLFDDAQVDGIIIAFVGKPRRRHEGDVLLYCGQQWHQVHMNSLEDPGNWDWEEALGDEMVGTFNGAAEQLLAMMLDAARGRDFFPARPAVKFNEAIEIDTFPGTVRGVAVYDTNGDGKLDLYACNESGNRAYLQTSALKFENRTKELGLSGLKSVSCSFADVDADGYTDLLVDDVILLGSKDGFGRTQFIKPDANRKVKCASFVEVNGDGFPDVIVSCVAGGLRLFLNPAEPGSLFEDATAASGLSEHENGANSTGFFAAGDFNGDGCTDLYYAAGKGLIMLQDDQGRFSAVKHSLPIDCKVSDSQQVGLTGAGCFASLWKPDSLDLVSPADLHFVIGIYDKGTVRNVTGFGNEIRLGTVSQLATLAEDLNMDGHVDLLTISRRAEGEAVFHANRGYGSYMLSDLYMDYEGLPGKAFTTGAWSIAAGDVNDDGATDLLFGGIDGVLRLAINDAFNHELRKPKEHPTSLEMKLAQSRTVTVKLKGNIGVLGAEVRLLAQDKRVVARRLVGSNILTGCRSADSVNLVLRGLGPHKVLARFSDGSTVSKMIQALETKRVVVTIHHK